ncbi:hypothetical protein I79_006385 [Cricetulus griseus]|uniref:Uncharacterized protein n=1 Tax=Cricetulus griseus TaxID=10029 RepID=G3H7P9_CRIGR|nr:hypothetical protein I79_006385 [Cricetulus griseus]
MFFPKRQLRDLEAWRHLCCSTLWVVSVHPTKWGAAGPTPCLFQFPHQKTRPKQEAALGTFP